MAEYYVQCEMHKQISDTTYKSYVAWIPKKCAKMNKIIRLKIDGEWVEGLKVVFVGAKVLKEQVEAASRDYKNQRSESDI